MASVLAELVNTMAQAGSSGRPAGMAPSVVALAQMLAGGAVQPGVPAVPHGLGPQWIDPHGSGEVGGSSIGGLIGPGTGFGAGLNAGYTTINSKNPGALTFTPYNPGDIPGAGLNANYTTINLKNPSTPTPKTPYKPGEIPGPGLHADYTTINPKNPNAPTFTPSSSITPTPPGGGPAYGNPTAPPAIPGPGGGFSNYTASTTAFTPDKVVPTAQWQPADRPEPNVGSTQYPVVSATSQYNPPAGANEDPTYGRKVPAVENIIDGRSYEVNIPDETYLRTLIAAAGGGPGINNVGAEAAAKNPALLFNEGKPTANWSNLGTVTPFAQPAGAVSAVPVDPVKRTVTGCR